MGKVAVFIFLLFLVALGFFAVENKDMVSIKIPFGAAHDIPKIALILLSSAAGALTVLLVFFVRDTKRLIDNLQHQKIQKKETKIQGLYSKALNDMLSNKEEEARETLKDILDGEPEHIDALLRLGDIAFGKKDYEAALGYYKNARDIEPKKLQILLSIEAVMEKMQRYEDAMKCIEEIIEIDPVNLTALYKKRLLLENAERWDELLSLQKAIIKLGQGEKNKQEEERRLMGYNYEYARFSLESGEVEKAEKAFRAVLKMDSSFISAYIGLAEAILTKGETEEAINFLEKGFEQLNSIIILARLEDLLISVGEPGRLIRFYKTAVAKNPHDYGLKFLLGKLYYRLEMIDDAMDILNSIDTSVFSMPMLYSLKGELHNKRNQTNSALKEFKNACGIKRPFLIQYCCRSCDFKSDNWSGRCPQCLKWNTYKLDMTAS